MNQNLLSRVLEFLRRKMWSRRWQRAVTCFAAVVVFGVTYALILPAITMTKGYPTLEAEMTEAWTGEGLAVKVTAESQPGEAEKIIVLTMEGEGADLSGSYVFNEEGVCIVTDDAGREIELHRSIREDSAKTAGGRDVSRISYWFRLAAGEETTFSLDLIDEVDETRFAATVEAMRQGGEEAAETATASDASKAAAKTASASDAGKAAPAENKTEKGATASNAATATASDAETVPVTTENDFEELQDGVLINDLGQEEDEDEGQTETVADLKLSAGIGDDYEAAVKDAAKNAAKRGDAEVHFIWRDVIAEKAASANLMSFVNGASIAVFCDEKSGIPKDAGLSVREIEEGSEEYEDYLAQAKSAMANATSSDATKMVSAARFFDISIIDGDGNEIQPETPVKVVITYDEGMKVGIDGDLNVVHFKEEDPEVFAPSRVESGARSVEGLTFTAESFSVYGIVGMETITTTYLTADGEKYKITVTYGPEAGIPNNAVLSVREVEGSELTPVQAAVEGMQSDEVNVALSRTFDIKILGADGQEIQPAEKSSVEVAFELEQVGDANLSTSVFHIHEENNGELSATALKVETEGGEAIVVTDSFSYYHLEFTYGAMTYLRDTKNAMVFVTMLRSLGFTINRNTNITSLWTSAPEKIILDTTSANYRDWTVQIPDVFEGEEYLYFTMNGVNFEIKVKCVIDLPEAYNSGTSGGVRQYGDNTTFLHGCEYAHIFILEEKMKEEPVVTLHDLRFEQVTGTSLNDEGEEETAERIVYKGDLTPGAKTSFDGLCCTLLYKDAAILSNGDLGDIQLEFSDVSFYTEADSSGAGYQADRTNVVEFFNSEYGLPRVESGNVNANLAVGLEVTVTTTILKKDGSPAEGDYYYGMRDIDISRTPAQRAGSVFDAENHHYFSEQVQIVSGAKSVAYIPAESDVNGKYLCGISNNSAGKEDANGLLFTPTLATPDPGEYADGFATLADAGGFTIIVRSASINGAVHTTVSPGSIGGVWVKKTVQDGTESDYTRNWEIEMDIDGTKFRDDHMKHGDDPEFVGAFTRDYEFTAEEILPNDSIDYETSWLVKAIEVINGEVKEVQEGSGTGPTASGTIFPKTIMEYVNKRIWVDDLLTIKKLVLNPNDQADLEKDWWFTLTLFDGKEPDTVPITGLATPANAHNWTKGENDGEYRFTLKDKETLQIRLPLGCSYYVVEDDYPDYFTTYVAQSGTLPDKTEAIIKNIPKPDVNIKKENKNGQFIPGARFKLLRKDESDQYVPYKPPAGEGADFEIPENGYKIEKMDPGSYKLVETSAPAGYIILTSEFEFTYDINVENSTPVITPVTQTGDVVIDNEKLIITVKNTPGTELPATGGPGTTHYTLGGLMLLIISALLYGFRRRHEERRAA